jgi:hypothetical protein
MQANAKGIKNFDECHSILLHILIVIGSRIANAPILFINEDKNAAINKSDIKN